MSRPARLVQYSLSQPRGASRPDLIWQFAGSVRTLREHNRRIPVALFLHGSMTPELATICGAYGVMVHEQGPYEQRLADLSPAGWRALAHYPLLHKFLNFRELTRIGPSQVLCCDCDTVFFGDVERLFDLYGTAHVVAREEVHSGRSAYGSDRTFIDEPLLAEIARRERVASIAPFNLGVVLFNEGTWRAVAALEGVFVDYAWRFATWMAQHPAEGLAAAYGEFVGAEAAGQAAGATDVARALPYPSANRWILDEFALWLTLGRVHGLRTADFRATDVAQNGEFARSDPRSAGWILCHYFSQNVQRIDQWIQDGSPVGRRL